MNQLIRVIIFVWLLLCALIAWAGCAVVGFFLRTSDFYWLHHITPLMGLTIGFCIIKCAIYVLRKSDPIAYIVNKYQWLGDKLGKKI